MQIDATNLPRQHVIIILMRQRSLFCNAQRCKVNCCCYLIQFCDSHNFLNCLQSKKLYHFLRIHEVFKTCYQETNATRKMIIQKIGSYLIVGKDNKCKYFGYKNKLNYTNIQHRDISMIKHSPPILEVFGCYDYLNKVRWASLSQYCMEGSNNLIN